MSNVVSAASTPAPLRPRALAFYLPQFHPIPENDEWWGAGFTEWSNVVRAAARFRGHDQPRLPADLGFYDLRVPAVRLMQAEMARSAGIDGFVYYHYWFHGRRLLESPVTEMLTSGQPDFPFALCWANESWSRNWDGSNDAVLVEQQYSASDDELHMTHLLRVMEDRRYIRVDDRPLLLIYRLCNLPDPLRTIATWRQLAADSGQELYICEVDNQGVRRDPRPLGVDATVEFVPNPGVFGPRVGVRGLYRLRKYLAPSSPFRQNRVYLYDEMVEKAMSVPLPDFPFFRCVTPSWDNSPRRRTGSRIVTNCTPASYERWLRLVIAQSAGSEFVFINAWNEWAEGAYLEPDSRWGWAYLDATRRALATRLSGRCLGQS